MTEINIGNEVRSIPDYAFSECTGLRSVTIPEPVTEIGNNAFAGCSGLTSVSISKTVTDIGNRAFQNCGSLAEIFNYATEPQEIDDNVFQYVTTITDCVLYVHDVDP